MGNFQGRILSQILQFWLFAKVFSAKFGGIAFFGTAKVGNL